MRGYIATVAMGTDEARKAVLLESFYPRDEEIDKWMCVAFEMASFSFSVMKAFCPFSFLNRRSVCVSAGQRGSGERRSACRLSDGP